MAFDRLILLPTRSDAARTGPDVTGGAEIQTLDGFLEYESIHREWIYLSQWRDQWLSPECAAIASIPLARLMARQLWALRRGMLIQIMPILRGVEAMSGRYREVTVVLPDRGIVWDSLENLSRRLEGRGRLELKLLPELADPLSHSGFPHSGAPRPRSLAGLHSLFSWLALQAGRPLVRQPDAARTLLIGRPDHRELTPALVGSGLIRFATLRPRLLTGAAFRDRLCPLDSLVRPGPGGLLRHWKEGRRARRLLARLRSAFDSHLGSALSPDIPSGYLYHCAASVLAEPAVGLFSLINCLPARSAGVENLLTVAGGLISELHFDLAKRRGWQAIELSHSTLMLDPAALDQRQVVYLAKAPEEAEFLREHFPARPCSVVGRPMLDLLHARTTGGSPEPLPEVCSTLNEQPFALVIASIRSDEENLAILLETVASAVTPLVCLKLHPSLDPQWYRSAIRRREPACSDRVLILQQEATLAILIPHAAVVVSGFSNGGLEALLSGRPTVFSGLTRYCDLYFLRHPQIRPLVVPVEQLATALKLLAAGPVQPELLDAIRRSYRFDGRISDRLTHFLRELQGPPAGFS